MSAFPTCSTCAKWILGMIVNGNQRKGRCREDGSVTVAGYSCLQHSDREPQPMEVKQNAK